MAQSLEVQPRDCCKVWRQFKSPGMQCGTEAVFSCTQLSHPFFSALFLWKAVYGSAKKCSNNEHDIKRCPPVCLPTFHCAKMKPTLTYAYLYKCNVNLGQSLNELYLEGIVVVVGNKFLLRRAKTWREQEHNHWQHATCNHRMSVKASEGMMI